MTQLLPTNKNPTSEEDIDLGGIRDRKILTHVEENGNTKMTLSQTSDLTASLTSNDITLRNFDSPSVYYRKSTREGSLGMDGISGTDDYDDVDGVDSGGGSGGGGCSETDTLLNNKKASRILNLTHIDDHDICFADD